MANLRLQYPAQAETILAIGEGRSCDHAIIMSQDTQTCQMLIGLPSTEYYDNSDKSNALEWLYGNN